MATYKAFMAHIPKEHWRTTAEHLAKKFKDYLVVGEHKPYHHLHYLVKMTDDEYRNYANSVFRQKHKLRGRATKDQCRQYGKIKHIRDLEKLKAYMVKDGIEYNVNVWTSMNKNELEKLFKEISYEKQERDPHKKFINYLKNNDISHQRGVGHMLLSIITVNDLAKTWLMINNTRLPKRETLLFYAYQAGRLAEHDYIKKIYYDQFEEFEAQEPL